MQGIFYESPTTLRIIDQLLLPHHEVHVNLSTVQETYIAIKSMQVRGAPAIAIVAMLGLSVHLQNTPDDIENIEKLLTLLSKSRPTAVNLFNAISDVRALLTKSDNRILCIQKYAEDLLTADRIMCDAIATNGVKWVHKNLGDKDIVAITICNTGSLATAGCGTALGIIKKLHQAESLKHCYFLETRPYNQGARLTAVELLSGKIPCTMICDSMVAFLLKKLNDLNNKVVVIVGADRITEKFVYNKIGTLNLAIVSQFYNVPFIVAAPTTSFAIDEKFEIEERPDIEMTTINGLYKDDIVNVKIAADVNVWNPAFDTLQRSLVNQVISEQ